MNPASINAQIIELSQTQPLSRERFEAVLTKPLTQTSDNPSWTFYSFEPPQPFASGDLRLNTEGTRALLVLTFPEASSLTLSDLDLQPFGELRGIDANPHIAPEGADAYIYELNGVQISFQFRHQSKRLRLIALEWKGQSAG